jgi:pimeloyl-ACP methyl ester carboxylesterase
MPPVHRSSARFVAGRDGTRVAWHTYEPASPESCTTERRLVVLTNGLGTTPNFWRPLASELAPKYRVVDWSYRGHAESNVSRSGDYAVTSHADDLDRVSRAAGATFGDEGAAIHIAFSMGVTVLLEHYRRHPEKVRAMVLVAGGADYPYASVPIFRVPGAKKVLDLGLRAAAPVIPRLTPITERLSRSKTLFTLGRTFGALTETAPREELEHFFESVGNMDIRAYWGSLTALFRAHASDVLPTVKVPVLVVASSHDVMAPDKELEALRDGIRGAAFIRVPESGHAVLLEAGGEVGRVVGEFLSRLSS